MHKSDETLADQDRKDGATEKDIGRAMIEIVLEANQAGYSLDMMLMEEIKKFQKSMKVKQKLRKSLELNVNSRYDEPKLQIGGCYE